MLEEFNKLLDEKFLKFNQYLEEGKTSEEAFALFDADFKELLKFVEDNRAEIQEELREDSNDPLRLLITLTLFPNFLEEI